MNPMIGKLLDNRYELLEVIGTGGMAVVYKALCHRLNRMVAIKILKDEYSNDDEFRRRFKAEGEAVAMLSHPNIVQVFDVSSTNHVFYIVMELIDGISLKQYMQSKGQLNWKETLHFATQIAKGLEHAHGRGIVHRDIKPHNVMVLKNGSVKVMDFGIAQVMNKSSTLTKEALGSVHYISPEQAKGSYTDNRSDIYSLGVVMYEMMTGRPPYDGDSPVAVAIKHINGGAALPSSINGSIPAGLEQIIMKCMALDPRDRFTTATELMTDLEEFRKNPGITFSYHALVDDATRVIRTPDSTKKTIAERKAEARGGTVSSGTSVHLHRAGNPDPFGSQAAEERRSQEALARAQRRRREEERRAAERSRVATIAVVACSAVAVLAIVVFLVAIFNGALVNQERELVEVPYLVGDTYTEDFHNRYPDFVIRLQPQQYDDFYTAGQIMRQEPVGGSKVNKGTEIYLTISMGKEPTVKLMEDLAGVTQDRAVSFLTGQGLKTLIREEASDTYPAGSVTRTEPAADAELLDGQTVKLWISTGPDRQMEQMPNVLNMSRELALQVLEQLGFQNVSVNPVFSNKNKGNVVSQSETAKSMIDVTTHIILEVSNGPEVEAGKMPDVLKLDADAAVKILNQMGFVNVMTYSVQSSLPAGQVSVQSEDYDAVVPYVKEIRLGVSDGSQYVPGTIPADPVGPTQPTAEYVTFNVPLRDADYSLVIARKGHPEQQVAAGTIRAGESVFNVALADQGVQEYDLYINGEYYQTMRVEFNNNG